MAKPLTIGLAGFGVVGGGLCQLLRENGELIRARAGREISVKTILVRDPKKARSIAAPEGAKITTNADDLVRDAEIDAVAELMGGVEAPLKLIGEALANGKHVVTANKALLAERGGELFRLARAKKRALRYEASVAGAIPVLESLKSSLAGNRILSVSGILNGTSNYVLSEMSANYVEFGEALTRAQELGYAEADPTLDIDGEDAAHKLIILIRLAFGLDYPLKSLRRWGIGGISALDIRMAREFGFRVKLIGEARLVEDDGKIKLAAGVFPTLVHHKFLLARVGGAFNAVRLIGAASGPLFFHGKGAGALPTAGAVLADLIAEARGDTPNNSGFYEEELPAAEILPAEDWRACFYARLMVADAPGVLRDISGCMAAEAISVAQMIQKAETGAKGVPLVFMTHETSERAMRAALKRASEAGLLKEEPVYLRVMERDFEN